MQDSDDQVRHSPLQRAHERLGARFTDFGGWSMPLSYGSQLEEHAAVRRAAGLFDVSHMAEFAVNGPGAAAFLDFALAGKISSVAIGRAKYSLLLSETGGVIDDLIVYVLGEGDYMVVSNAGNHDAVAAAFDERQAGFDVLVHDATYAMGMIALQGPASVSIVADIPGLGPGLADLRYYGCLRTDLFGTAALVARTGYTGEDGFEIVLPVEKTPQLWDALLTAGEPRGLVPAGLAARDTLRLEAGMPLHGHELTVDTLPAQARLGRVVATSKPHFVGREAILASTAPDAPSRPVLVGLVGGGRRAARAGYPVLAFGRRVGEITSGALSPTLGYPIAMAYVDPDLADTGRMLDVDVRGNVQSMTVVDLPFYHRDR